MRMLRTFWISFKLKNTYRTNGIIYSLKSIPGIRKLLPASLYGSRGLKIFSNIVSMLMEFNSIFVPKLLYVLLLIFFAAGRMKSSDGYSHADSFLHMFFFLTLVGGFLNTHIFNPTKDKYYAIFLLRMEAREYTLSNYFYFLLKTVVGLLPFVLIFGLTYGVPIAICLSMPLYVISVKLIFTAIKLRGYRKKGRTRNENMPAPVVWAGVAAALTAAYVPPFFGYAMKEWIYVVLLAAAVAGAAFCLRQVFQFQEYRSVYKKLLTTESYVMSSKERIAQLSQKNYQKKIDLDATSNKSGYRYFNELFMKRHRRLLTKSAKRITLASIGVLLLFIAGCMLFPGKKAGINRMLMTSLPYFLFIMYFVNRGKVITQAMFMNCDHSMLAYRFFRQPKALLLLFTERLKSVLWINLMPATVIAVSLPLLLWVSGGTDNPLNYVLLFVSIIAMSIFFSVHNLVLYYLLQPYNIQLEMKSSTFTIVNSLTYFVCYFAIGRKVPTLIFGTLISGFCILYIIIALIVAYRLAPKTFRLR